MENIEFLIIHSTGTPADVSITADSIRRYHLNNLGWSKPGYFALIKLDGSVESVWDFDLKSGLANSEITNGMKWTVKSTPFIKRSIQLCYAGGAERGLPSDTRSKAQKETMLTLIKLISELKPEIRTGGHRDFPDQATGCPGFDVKNWLLSEGIPSKNIFSKEVYS